MHFLHFLWEHLVTALTRCDFFGLHVQAVVHVVVPRNVRRLARVTHAFGPVTLAAFHVSGGDAEQACFEDECGMGGPVVIEATEFVRRLEAALSAERIPFAVVSGLRCFDHGGAAMATGLYSADGACRAFRRENLAGRGAVPRRPPHDQ